MNPKDFIDKYRPYAKMAEIESGLQATVILAQSALETGWGEKAPGNMMFGIKDTDGLNGNEQLITTTEYSKSDKLSFPEIISKVFNPVTRLWKYKVKDWFRKYPSPYESFISHSKFLKLNKRYEKVFTTNDPTLQIRYIALAGYATDPNYEALLLSVHKTVIRNL